ncbi:hypothetical protein Tco_1499971 [Tanacetum coccineum]
MSSVGKFVHDSNKAPDSPPHPHTVSSNQRHCFHCKDVLGDGEFCQRCTCMRCGSGLSKGLCLICASRYGNNPNLNSLNDSPNISENVSQSPPLIDHHFLIISNPEPCNNQTIDELPQTLPSFDPTCYSGDGNSFTYDSTPNFVNDSPNVFNPPPQPQYVPYSCELCGNDAHHGYDCPPQVPFNNFEGFFSDSNNDSTSIDDDSFSIDDIDYVEASPPDSELVSLEEVKDFHTEGGEIEDNILREKLSKINILIAMIEAINSNPPPSSDFVTKSPSIFSNSFLKETNTFDNSIPESETFISALNWKR